MGAARHRSHTVIAAICSVRNEAGIIESSIRHHFGQGVDAIYLSDAMSTDGTREILDRLGEEFGPRLLVMDDTAKPFIQEREMTRLAQVAVSQGADWVVPFDADEFIYDPIGGTIADVLDTIGPSIGKLAMRVFRHHDWNLREIAPEYPRKVLARGVANLSFIVGQHDASTPGEGVEGFLDIRELKYRSFEHFRSKIAGHLETMRPEWGPQFATHVQKFRGASEERMREAWDQMMAVPTVLDPIPSTLTSLL